MGETESEREPLMGRNVLSLTLFGTALHGNNKKQTDFFVDFNIIFKFFIDKVPPLFYTSGGQFPLSQHATASQHGCLWTVGVSD